MIWTASIALYFLVAAILAIGRSRLGRLAPVVASVPFFAQLAVVVGFAAVSTPRFEAIEWIPSLEVTIGFRIDPLTLLLTTIVAAIGLLIVIYTAGYMDESVDRTRFLGLMVLFSGGMAGIVSSDDLFGLFVFWEVTTVASYLLIGFNDKQAAARSAALQAILVTTAGGLAMLAGFVLLTIASGTANITALVNEPPTGPVVTTALLLVFLGAFTKSAQVPFHFWLPGAMAAPTPASAYLHSATMVKAGIVLLVFLAPGFATLSFWGPLVTAVGLATMSLGAVVAMWQRDLKLLLAYGTVSQLGFMMTLIGLDLIGAAVAVLVAHALFKAALFLVVGIVDKSTGTRDVEKLSGLGRRQRGLATIAALSAMSMAGIPPLLGFVTKEAAIDTLIAGSDWLALAVIAAASILTVAYSARFWWGAFATKPDLAANVVAPLRTTMVLPAALLAAASLMLGLFPARLGSIITAATGQTTKLVLWPGFKPALAVSTFIIVAGAVAWNLAPGLIQSATFARLRRSQTLSAAGIYQATLRGLNLTAKRVAGFVQNGSLPTYLAVILTTVVAIPTAIWLTSWEGRPVLPATNGPAEIVLGAVVVAAAVGAARAQRRMAAVLLLGVVGYAVAGIYVTFGAPDLALTQVLVETLTVALFALVLAKLPRRFGIEPRSLSRRVRIGVAALVGSFAASAAVLVTAVSPERSVSSQYTELAPEAGGTNVVNVILTNFRALDTLGEITVLAAAAIGVGALVAAGRRKQRSDGVPVP